MVLGKLKSEIGKTGTVDSVSSVNSVIGLFSSGYRRSVDALRYGYVQRTTLGNLLFLDSYIRRPGILLLLSLRVRSKRCSGFLISSGPHSSLLFVFLCIGRLLFTGQ
ncbi:hypothetical protein SODALDRAFT_47221 [Sodiomyces alkalinus F11]|uniref:Uncharacterized protein n=1 Tax=Sodiomyces alkalinus (strain CBS 110278 / VKM F-3762 / F11) TaxID=1314773 RepID=A0A3N2QAJ3_SODAK|nr:hypothetical protein SODALDRAFT_47221 [Sodiomyces alkalinus F11]ROT43771.1 hypothetical protein SODALDRAFT_47221 [Sodiomyces alkalinus F11]